MPRFAWVFVLLAACGGAATSVRNSEPYVIVLRIEGGTIDPDDLIPRLGLSRNHAHAVDDYQLSLDLERIKAAYQRRGFFAVEVKSRFAKPPDGGGATIVFTVIQGPRAAAHVELIGLPPDIPESKARTLVKVDEGAPFDYDTFEAAKEPLQDLVQDAGYAHARLVSNVIADRARATAVLRYIFDPGPASKFGLIPLNT